MIMAGLGALIARRFVKMPHLSGFTLLLWNRLNRAVRRLHRVMTRPPGKARPPQLRAARTDTGRTRPASLPAGRGWIVRELGWEAAAYMGYLELLLAEPEMQAVLARVPGAGRILRPLCRMLGVPVAAATPPVMVVAEAAADIVAAPIEVATPQPGAWPQAESTELAGLAGDCARRPKNE